MKSYVVVTGIVFALIVIAHVARFFAEGHGVLASPTFLFTSLLSAGLLVWSVRLFRKLRRPSGGP